MRKVNRICPEDIEIIVMLILIVVSLRIAWPAIRLLWLVFMN